VQRFGFLLSLVTAGGLVSPALSQDVSQPAVTAPETAQEQAPEVLIVDFNRSFNESILGQRILESFVAEGDAIAAENRKIEAELIEEEQALTLRRLEMDAQSFQPLANAFDQKVQTLRAAQDAKERSFTSRRDNAPRQFLQMVYPLMEQLMKDQGAKMVLDRRFVIVMDGAVDVTDQAIALINANVTQTPAGTDTTGADQN
jgi:Skp family chaperone for outer membrane proteins